MQQSSLDKPLNGGVFYMANRYIDKNAGDDVYKYIMELVPQTDDLNIFLKKIYMRYNMPVIVTDIAFHLIAYGGPYPCPDPLGVSGQQH